MPFLGGLRGKKIVIMIKALGVIKRVIFFLTRLKIFD
jgi:hypothetical protein